MFGEYLRPDRTGTILRAERTTLFAQHMAVLLLHVRGVREFLGYDAKIT